MDGVGPGSIYQCDDCGTHFVYQPYYALWCWVFLVPPFLTVIMIYNMLTFGLRVRGGNGWWMLRGTIGLSVAGAAFHVNLFLVLLRSFDII